MTVIVDGSTIVLSGTVGDLYWDDSFDASDVIMALAEVGRDTDITVRINSSGGIATEGSAIYAALAAHQGNITVIIEGIAASAASIIAMAGDDIVMSLGAVMMVHDPSALTLGTAADHQLSINSLNALGDAMAAIYAEQTGKPVGDARADMRAELWMTPEQAVAAGYADRVLGKAENDNTPDPEPTAFDFRLYQHPPERLVALADAHAWTKRKRPVATHVAPTPRRKDPPMANDPAGKVPANDKTHTAEDVKTASDNATATAKAATAADAAEIITLCANAGVPLMAAALVKDGVSVADARTRIDSAKDIRGAVALARQTCPAIEASLADQFIAAGTSLQGVREQLFQKMTVAQSPDIAGQHQAGTGSPDKSGGDAASRAQSKANMKVELQRKGMLPKKEG